MFCPSCAAENPNEAQFCGGCGKALPKMEDEQAEVGESSQAAPAASPAPARPAAADSKRMVVGLLAIFLGWLGIHKFMLGYNVPGVILLVMGLLGFVTFGLTWFAAGVVGLIEGIIYLTKSDEDFRQIYVENQKPWF